MICLDLSQDARIRYVSDSVEDILGYLPYEVINKSCWEYFHPDEIPFARAIHGRGVELDKAAVLNYCRIKHKQGYWAGCECVFTIVYDVLVASTSIYQRGPRSEQRASEAPVVRRLFSSSPRDPRYHMLSYISNKFVQNSKPHAHEPRAALFLNRFTRTSTIMFATNGVSTILGIAPEQLVAKSFYFCIAENCLQDAVRCLESAKANDSIAYLRFWFRRPAEGDDGRDRDVQMQDARHSSDEDEDEGGVHLSAQRSGRHQQRGMPPPPVSRTNFAVQNSTSPSAGSSEEQSRSSSDHSVMSRNNTRIDTVFDAPMAAAHSSSSSLVPENERSSDNGPLEIEAVVSCTSDGLVVILRRALPLLPYAVEQPAPVYANGLFASPWAPEPVVPSLPSGVPNSIDTSVHPSDGSAHSNNYPSTPILGQAGDPVMSAIRDVAVFAWSLTGINGSLVQYGRGTPTGESQPPGGFPIWDPNSNADPDNKFNGFSNTTHRRTPGAAQPMDIDQQESSGSEDVVVWRRSSVMPQWQPNYRTDRTLGLVHENDEHNQQGQADDSKRDHGDHY
ncbi:MAG: hypothetical protein Q9227_009034 [Pyrenula ochraceoflavens]